MNRKFFVVLMSSLFIFACGKKLPTVDSSTPETYKDSLEQVSQSYQRRRKIILIFLSVFWPWNLLRNTLSMELS